MWFGLKNNESILPNVITLLLFVFIYFSGFTQKKTTYILSDKLSEISGLEFINDTTLVAINDGGNTPHIYVLNLDGSIRKKVEVSNAKNHDWEDLAYDGKHLFIADFGNNLNKRKHLSILKVKASDILKKKKVEASKIKFEYKEQKEFPPARDELHFDAEALVCYNDSLCILTKDRTKPSTGESWCYMLPKKKGEYKIKRRFIVQLGKGGFWKDAITGADVEGDELSILTYNRIIRYDVSSTPWKKVDTIDIGRVTQKESIVRGPNCYYLADEKQWLLGGGKLYKVEKK